MTLQAIFILSISSLFYIYEFFLRVMPSVITHELMSEFQINASLMSLMTSCFLYAYALMQIPSGMLIDRYGPRIVLTFAVIICAVATYMFQSTTDITVAIISRLMLGAASSVAFIAPLTLASRWFKAKHLALVAGCVQILGCVGAILGGAPIAYLNAHIGWRPTLVWASSLGFALAFVFWIVIKDHPTSTEETAKPSISELLSQVVLILKHQQNLWIALASFASWCAMGSLAELWGVPFLIQFHNLSAQDAALLIMIIWLGVAFGSPLAGFWCERVNNHRQPLILLLSLSAITTTILIYCNQLNHTLVYINLFLMGMAAGAQPVTFSLIAIHNPPSRIATAFGFNNMAVVCGASLLQPSIGLLLDYFWDGTYDGIRIYSTATYQSALSIVPIAITLGILSGIFFIKEKQRRTHE